MQKNARRRVSNSFKVVCALSRTLSLPSLPLRVPATPARLVFASAYDRPTSLAMAHSSTAEAVVAPDAQRGAARSPSASFPSLETRMRMASSASLPNVASRRPSRTFRADGKGTKVKRRASTQSGEIWRRDDLLGHFLGREDPRERVAQERAAAECCCAF